MAQEQAIGQKLIVETVEAFRKTNPNPSEITKAKKDEFIQQIKDAVRNILRDKSKDATAIKVCTDLETRFANCDQIFTPETQQYLQNGGLLTELQKTIKDLKDLETTVAKGLQKIVAAATGFIQANPNPKNLDTHAGTTFSALIEQAIKETLNEMPKNVEVNDFRKKLSGFIHPDKIKNANTGFTTENLQYLEAAELLNKLQQASEKFKDYIPEPPTNLWGNPSEWIQNTIVFSFVFWGFQMASEYTDDPEAAQDARTKLKEIKKTLKKEAPLLAFIASLSSGLDKYPRPLRFFANTLSGIVFNIPLLIGAGCIWLASKICQSAPQLLQYLTTFFLNLTTNYKYHALEREQAIEKMWEKREHLLGQTDITLDQLKTYLNDNNDAVLEVLILGISWGLCSEPFIRTKLTFIAAWKSLTQIDDDQSKVWFALTWLPRFILLIPICAITIAIQAFRFILSTITSAVIATLVAVKFVSLFVLNIPRLLFKLPKYLGQAWDNRAELASTFGNWLSQKAVTLSSGVLLSLAAVGVAAAVFGLDPRMLGIVATVSGVLSLILTHDDLDVGNRGFKFGVSLMIFLGAAVMVFFAFGPILFPEIAEFIPSLPQLLDYLLPFAEPIQAAIAAAGAVAIVLLPTIIAGTTDKVVEACASTDQDEPPKKDGEGGLGWHPVEPEPNPDLGDPNAYNASPTGSGSKPTEQKGAGFAPTGQQPVGLDPSLGK